MNERRKPGGETNFGVKMMNFTLVHTNLEMPNGNAKGLAGAVRYNSKTEVLRGILILKEEAQKGYSILETQITCGRQIQTSTSNQKV